MNKNGGDRLGRTSISSIFEEEILENCRFWEVQTSGFGLCIIYPNYLSCFKVVPEPGQRNSFSKRLFVPHAGTEYGLFVQKIVDSFWKRWTRDTFPSLVPRRKWDAQRRNVRVDDVVNVADTNAVIGENGLLVEWCKSIRVLMAK